MRPQFPHIIQVAGSDPAAAPARFRPPRVDGLGALYVLPDRDRNGIYAGLQRVLTHRVVSLGYVAYRLDPDKWSKVELGGATVAFEPTTGEIQLLTTGSVGSEALLIHNTTVVFSTGHGQLVRWIHRASSPTQIGALYEWGLCTFPGAAAGTDRSHGFYIEDGVFGVYGRLTGGFTLRTPQSAFNVDKLDGTGPSGWTVTPAHLVNATVYSVHSDWRVIYRVGEAVVHVIDLGNPATSPLITPSFHPPLVRMFYRHKKLAAGEPSSSYMSSAIAEAIGDTGLSAARYASPAPNPVTVSGGTERPLLVLRPALIYEGVTNGKRLLPHKLDVKLTQTGRVKVYIGTALDLVLSDAAFATPTGAAGTAAEIDVSATAVTINTGAVRVAANALTANVEKGIDLSDVFTLAGRSLTVRGDGTQSMLVVIVENTAGAPAQATVEGLGWDEVI